MFSRLCPRFFCWNNQVDVATVHQSTTEETGFASTITELQ